MQHCRVLLGKAHDVRSSIPLEERYALKPKPTRKLIVNPVTIDRPVSTNPPPTVAVVANTEHPTCVKRAQKLFENEKLNLKWFETFENRNLERLPRLKDPKVV